MPDELGEFELIAALRERIERAGAPPVSDRLVIGSGDDAAVTAGDGSMVISVDAAIEGVHFDSEWFSPRSIGHKALAAALSDLAAMGAAPGEAYVQLLLPPDFKLDACLELADGIASLAARHRVAIAGGDVSRAPVLGLALTVVGYLEAPGEAVRRSGAAPGEAVVLTGEVGGAAAGLVALRGTVPEGFKRGEMDPLIRRQLEPEARLDAGRALKDAGASAMIDVSDGLGADAGHLAASSGVAISIDLTRVPIQRGVAELADAAGADPLDLAAGWGEDYELLATLAPGSVGRARAAVEAAGVELTEIGSVREGTGVELIDARGAARQPTGYDQLATP